MKAHLDDADFFVADVSGANPNVMMELGAAYAGQPGKPALLITCVKEPNGKPDLPADLSGHITAIWFKHSVLAAHCLQLSGDFPRRSRSC